jgi:hypothetical protein
MAKQNKFTTVELDWAERKLAEWMTFVDANPFHTMTDRITLKETKNGGFIPVTSASIEQQQKNIRETIKDYLLLLAVVEDLRTKEEAKSTKSTYGNVSESIRMVNAVEQKDE